MIDVGRTIARSISSPTIVCLMGDLGAGKTTVAKGIISELTDLSPQEITSPTFQYVNVYQADRVVHFDLWRLNDLDEFLELGLDEYVFGRISLIEWPDRVEGWLPEERLSVEIHVLCGQGRKIEITQ